MFPGTGNCTFTPCPNTSVVICRPPLNFMGIQLNRIVDNSTHERAVFVHCVVGGGLLWYGGVNGTSVLAASGPIDLLGRQRGFADGAVICSITGGVALVGLGLLSLWRLYKQSRGTVQYHSSCSRLRSVQKSPPQNPLPLAPAVVRTCFVGIPTHGLVR